MSKTTAIILLVFMAALLFIIFRILLPSIKLYISRMPKGIFVLLFIVIIGVSAYLIDFLINDRTGGLSGNDNQNTTPGGDEEDTVIRENCIILRNDGVWVENEKADTGKIEKYLAYRAENNITVTIVDDYSTVAQFKEVKAICEKTGVRINVEDEEWLK